MMILDPAYAVMATSTLKHLKPTKPVKDPSDTAFPTVIPDPFIYQRAGKTGERTLWVVFVLMLLVSISFVVLSWTVPVTKRIYHHVTTTIVVIGTLSYFAMATHSGITWHHNVLREVHDTVPDTFKHVLRQVYWVRYLDWVLTTPLLLLNLGILAGLDGASIFTAISGGVVMVLSALFSAFGRRSGTRWGWYAIAIIAYLTVLFQVFYNGTAFVKAKGAKVSRFYTSIASYTSLVFAAYIVIWAVADGRKILSVDDEIIAYAVLDILAKAGFGFWLLFTYRSLPESHVEIDGFWTHGFSSEGRIRIENGDGA
jgi:bacteriorhodopsin